MLDQARERTRHSNYTNVEYERFADDIVILIGAPSQNDWLLIAVD